jgi:hypothetical protein
MQKRRPVRGGADLQIDRHRYTATRTVIKASPAMALRLAALKVGQWWAQ